MTAPRELLDPPAARRPDDYSADRPAGAPSAACQLCGCESSPKRQRMATGVYSPYAICVETKACDDRVMEAWHKKQDAMLPAPADAHEWQAAAGQAPGGAEQVQETAGDAAGKDAAPEADGEAETAPEAEDEPADGVNS